MLDRNGTPAGSILIGYDGSPEARHAVLTTAHLFRGMPAMVVHAWQPLNTDLPPAAAVGAAFGGGEQLIETEGDAARAVAAEGRDAALAAGLDAVGLAVEGTEAIWEILLTAIDTSCADLVVMGTRGLHGVRGAMIGSTSHSVITHSSVPVLVVPAPEES
jgi:nucleotide-binding universal stress UspA family protein